MFDKITQAVTDDLIAITTTLGVLGMVFMGIPVPEFLTVAYAMILAFYFKK